MAQQSIQGTPELARKIRQRRNELNLTIEEAASRAGVGTKTWSRYESGESIRKDKYRGICKALNWRAFPDEDTDAEKLLSFSEYKNHPAWSAYLAEEFGEAAAASFAIGSDILMDNLKEDLQELASMPKGTHIGQLHMSMLQDELPRQFYMEYDYNFMYRMYTTVAHMRAAAKAGQPIIAHSVLEELILYLIMNESSVLMEYTISNTDADKYQDWDSWVFDVLGDTDILTCLYSDFYLPREHEYHFEHWLEQRLYCE